MYSSFLIDCKKVDKAEEVLFLGLKNEINILLILVNRSKMMTKRESKRCVSGLYNRLSIIMFNLSVVYQLKKSLHLTSLCLSECLLIYQLQSRLLEKELKANICDYLKHY